MITLELSDDEGRIIWASLRSLCNVYIEHCETVTDVAMAIKLDRLSDKIFEAIV
jgi:hypothetical protein